jgi:hypothetical protein
MRLEHVGNVVAAALAAAAVSAPPAYARWPSPEGASPQNAASAQQRQPEGSTDWELIGLTAAGGVALLTAGVVSSRRVIRRTSSATATGSR